MKQDDSKQEFMKKFERDTKARIREELLALPHDQKLNLGLIAREPSVPNTVEYVMQSIRSFATIIVRNMHNNADTRMAAIEKLMSVHITLMYLEPEERMEREIVDKLSRTPFDQLLSAGVFGEATTPEMAEQHLQDQVEITYQYTMEERAESN